MDERISEQIRNRSTWETERKDYPQDVPSLPPIPAARYSDPDFFALEQRHVFGKAWLFAAIEDELREPGDVIGIEHLASDLLIVRASDGVVRAFYNTCSHRGARLVPEGKTHLSRRILCPYHNWSYELTGELRSVPERRDFRDLDTSCLGLRPVRCESWAGLVFVNFDADADPLRESLGAVVHELDSEVGDAAPDTEVHLIRKCSYEVPCNWKAAADANLETYHINALHRTTAADVIDQHTTTIALYPRGHSRMFLRARDANPPTLPLATFPHVGPLSAEGVLTYGLFPNIALVLAPYLMFTTNSWPVAPNRTRYDLYFMGAAPETAETKAIWDLVLGFNISVIEEDVAVLAGIQRGMDSGNLDSIPLGYQERRIYQLHEEIDRRIGSNRIPEALRIKHVLEPCLEVSGGQ